MIQSSTMRIVTTDDEGNPLTKGIRLGPDQNITERHEHSNDMAYHVPRVVTTYGQLQVLEPVGPGGQMVWTNVEVFT